MSQSPSTAGRKPRPASPEDTARQLVDGYILTLLGTPALRSGVRKALTKLRTNLTK